MRFYRVHLGGGRFVVWCQEHARRELERKKLTEVDGPCALCAQLDREKWRGPVTLDGTPCTTDYPWDE